MNEGRDKRINDPFSSDDEEFSLMHKEWSKVDSGLKNAGVRDGLEFGHDCVLQDGFNSAFRDALKMAVSAGKLQGSISALLSYQPSGEKDKDIRYQTAGSMKLPQETQLHELLTKNTDLLSQIPQLLKYPMPTAGSNIQSEITDHSQRSIGIANFASDSSNTVNQCLETKEENKEQPGEISHTVPASRNCEEVCSNRAHFWTQLESFKIQAGSLGVVAESERLS